MSYRLTNVSYNYGNLKALKPLSLCFNVGEIHAVVGQNGAGKTTLMRLLAGYIAPETGTIESQNETISMVHQHFMLIDQFTVEENIHLSQIHLQNKPSKTIKKAKEILKDLNWNLPLQAKVNNLSIGDHQRLEILKAILQETSFIILDEPTTVLSEKEVEALFLNLRYLTKQGKGIILIAHKPNEVIKIADHISVLKNGSLIWTKKNENITSNELIQAIVGTTFQKEIKKENNAQPTQTLLEIVNASTTPKPYEIGLKNISLKLKKGEIIGIGGIEGNGQKGIAQLILNFKKPNQGQRKETNKLTFAYLPQNPTKEAIATQMSLVENLLIDGYRLPNLKNNFTWSKQLQSWAKQQLEKFNVKYEDLKQPIKSLSGGNQQKLIIARLESLNADVWVAMNPTRGLDVHATSFVHQKIKEYAQKGTSIVLISSDLEELNLIADKIMFLRNGKLEKEFLTP